MSVMTPPGVFMSEDAIAMIIARLDKIDSKIDGLDGKYMGRELIESNAQRQGERVGTLEERLAILEEERKWLTRLVLGSVVAAVLALVVGVVIPLS